MSAVAASDVADSRVVIVDDNLPSAQFVHTLLTRKGFGSVTAVTNGYELLDHYEQLAPDLVLLDLHMPGIDGYTMLAELRRRASAADLPVLVLTADTTRQATHRALDLGANDFLTKPLDATELVLRVRNALQTRALHVGLQRRHRWLDAAGKLAADLLAGGFPEPLRRVSELALEAALADAAVVVLPSAPIRQDASLGTAHLWVGTHAGEIAATVGDAFAGHALDPAEPRLIPDLAEAAGGAAGQGPAGAALLVPLRGADRHIGALLLCRHRNRPAFTENELELACGFAQQAVVAVEFAQARVDQQRMLLLSDRHRIARDLHDQVIQRLFATGLRLQQIAGRIGPGPMADGIDERIEELDTTIAEIRSTIFGLRQERGAGPARLSLELRGLVDELSSVLGFVPQLRMAEPMDVVPDDVVDDILAAAREAITNIAKHASATRAEVSVALTGGEVVLEVTDDGVGMGGATRRSGLIYLAERAERHGGSFTVRHAPHRGTQLVWTASLLGDPSAPRGLLVLDGRDRDGSVNEVLVRAGVVTREPLSGAPLHLDGDV